ncbi:hypothetical protein GW17_00053861 [Ensete ventricosum]|nr:hypothetical protein GW17_00053861 [Ensete ventricosum]
MRGRQHHLRIKRTTNQIDYPNPIKETRLRLSRARKFDLFETDDVGMAQRPLVDYLPRNVLVDLRHHSAIRRFDRNHTGRRKRKQRSNLGASGDVLHGNKLARVLVPHQPRDPKVARPDVPHHLVPLHHPPTPPNPPTNTTARTRLLAENTDRRKPTGSPSFESSIEAAAAEEA